MITVTTLSGLTFNLMSGLLRVDTPLTDNFDAKMNIPKARRMGYPYTLQAIMSWLKFRNLKSENAGACDIMSIYDKVINIKNMKFYESIVNT